MKYIFKAFFLAVLFILLKVSGSYAQNQVSFTPSGLAGVTLNNPTSLQFGPDGRLYVSQQNGIIYAYTIQKNGSNNYSVSATETIVLIKNIPNHNDDGTLNASVTDRQVTGILVKGTATNPVMYVSSSDPRIGGGGTGGDVNLDTNSGIISKLTWNGTSWIKVDLVVGLPRSEENHATNGLQLDEVNNILYVAQGGNTNAGAPSNNFAFLTEYALSAAILSIDLNQIQSQFGGTYILPTLDDPTRPNTGPNGSDQNDPFGGNDGLNQSKLVAGGPVQVYSPGYRNPYDLVLTKAPGKAGRIYTIDNGPNGGWGGHPDQEGAFGDPLTTNVTNNYVEGEPGSTGPGPNDAKVNNLDGLHLVSKPGMLPIYAGHPNPIRANPAGAGLYWYNNDTNTAHFELNPTVDWPPVPLAMANPVEGDFRNAGVDDGALYTWPNSTNGLAEYTASKFFNGAMTGDLLTACFDGVIYRIKLNPDGTAIDFVEPLASGFGSIPLDVVAQGDGEIFEGTIWAATYGSNTITIFEPTDTDGAWKDVISADASTPIARHENAFIELNEKFYLVGGRETTTINIYDPVLKTWTTGAQLPFTMHHFQAIAWQGKIYVVGAYRGFYSENNENNTEYPVTNIYVYDPNTNAWTEGPAIPRPRGSAGVVVYNDEFYVIAGIVNGHKDGWVNWVDKYNPASNTWTVLSNAPRERDHFHAALIDGKIYLTGGRKTNAQGSVFGQTIGEVDVYTIATNTWQTLPGSANVLTQRAGTATAVLNNELYLIGGESLSQTISHNECEIFDPVSQTWRTGPPLIVGRHGTGAITFNNTIYVAAGSGNRGGGPVLNSMESLVLGTACSGINSFDLDDDGDCFSNADEILNGTDPCNPASRPADFNNNCLSDLLDDDDDGDGIKDWVDLFALDAANGMNTTIPLFYPFLNGDPGVGLFGMGFTGLMTNLTDNYADLFDLNHPDLIMGGAVGVASVPANAGDAKTNNQEYAFQFGFKINPADGPFIIESKLLGAPFFNGIAVNQLQNQTQGIYIGNGDQDNYLKLVLSANNGNPGITVYGENGGAEFINEFYPVATILSTDAIHAYIEVIPGSSTAKLYYRTSSGNDKIMLGTPVALPSAFTNLLTGSAAMAAGLIASSGTAPEFSASWDFMNITLSQAGPYLENAPTFYNRFVGSPTPGLVLDMNSVFNHDEGKETLTYSLISVEDNTFINAYSLVDGILTISFIDNETGSAKITVRATDNKGLFIDYEFLVQVIPEPSPILRLNGGGPDFLTWAEDKYFSGGILFANQIPIANTAEQPIYRSERWGDFSYEIPVPEPGYYRVGLHFAEIYHGIFNDKGIGGRVFNVEAEGELRLVNFDILKEAGGPAIAINKKLDSVYVSDGFLSLNFISVIDNAKISAIEVATYSFGPIINFPPNVENPGTRSVFEGGDFSLQIVAADMNVGDVLQYQASGLPEFLTIDPATGLITGTVEATAGDYPVTVTVSDDKGAQTQVTFIIKVILPVNYSMRINAGGGELIYGSEVWLADRFYIDGWVFTTEADITNTDKDLLYQSERFGGKINYEIPMPGAGTYRITLHFAEIYWNEAGKRLFNIDIEAGRATLSNYDIFERAGGANLATTQTFLVDVTDGGLTLNFTTTADQAKISGIELELHSACIRASITSLTVSAQEICSGGSTTLTVDGNLRNGTAWHLYTGSCGGTLVASNETGVFEVSPEVNTQYYVRGEGGCTVPGACKTVDVQVQTVDPSVTHTGNTLTATISGATYQWINCAGNTDIIGATGRSFTAGVTGSYAVRIMENGCTIVSACTDVEVTTCVEPSIESVTVSVPEICSGGTTTLTVSGNLGSATAWHLYSASCGGTFITSNATGIFEVSPVTNTTYYIRGEGGCVVPGTCTSAVVQLPVDASVTLSGNTITATASGATYQWINCNGNMDIVGETNKSFTAEESGQYAVRVTQNGCTAVSECVDMTIVGLSDNPSDKIMVYPNPAQSYVKVELPIPAAKVSIRITDAQGRFVLSNSAVDVSEMDLDIGGLGRGLYFIHIQSEKLMKTVKLIVN